MAKSGKNEKITKAMQDLLDKQAANAESAAAAKKAAEEAIKAAEEAAKAEKEAAKEIAAYKRGARENEANKRLLESLYEALEHKNYKVKGSLAEPKLSLTQLKKVKDFSTLSYDELVGQIANLEERIREADKYYENPRFGQEYGRDVKPQGQELGAEGGTKPVMHDEALTEGLSKDEINEIAYKLGIARSLEVSASKLDGVDKQVVIAQLEAIKLDIFRKFSIERGEKDSVVAIDALVQSITPEDGDFKDSKSLLAGLDIKKLSSEDILKTLGIDGKEFSLTKEQHAEIKKELKDVMHERVAKEVIKEGNVIDQTKAQMFGLVVETNFRYMQEHFGIDTSRALGRARKDAELKKQGLIEMVRPKQVSEERMEMLSSFMGGVNEISEAKEVKAQRQLLEECLKDIPRQLSDDGSAPTYKIPEAVVKAGKVSQTLKWCEGKTAREIEEQLKMYEGSIATRQMKKLTANIDSVIVEGSEEGKYAYDEEGNIVDINDATAKTPLSKVDEQRAIVEAYQKAMYPKGSLKGLPISERLQKMADRRAYLRMMKNNFDLDKAGCTNLMLEAREYVAKYDSACELREEITAHEAEKTRLAKAIDGIKTMQDLAEVIDHRDSRGKLTKPGLITQIEIELAESRNPELDYVPMHICHETCIMKESEINGSTLTYDPKVVTPSIQASAGINGIVARSKDQLDYERIAKLESEALNFCDFVAADRIVAQSQQAEQGAEAEGGAEAESGAEAGDDDFEVEEIEDEDLEQ